MLKCAKLDLALLRECTPAFFELLAVKTATSKAMRSATELAAAKAACLEECCGRLSWAH